MIPLLLNDTWPKLNKKVHFATTLNNENPSEMNRGLAGQWDTSGSVGGETVRAFVPAPLPPAPPLVIDATLREKLDGALLALGRLDSVTALLPNTDLFLYSYVRKEAVLSSQIEGTQSSLSDLLLFELEQAPGTPVNDVVEVSNYVSALEHGVRRLREGFPLSNRLLRETHEILLSRGRGAKKTPGEFRRSQNWIGGSRPANAVYVPPPHHKVEDCMGALERWLHDQPDRTPPLIKAALSHVQFETIHPFLDGNGRVGRMLITLLLCTERVLGEPLLYLSLYLKRNRAAYYELLDQVRSGGDWEAWLRFFADGVIETAEGAVSTAKRLAQLTKDDAAQAKTVGRTASSAIRVHQEMQRRPLQSIGALRTATGLSTPAVTNGLNSLIDIGIVREVTGRKRNRAYSYHTYLDILSEGTEPL